jgi:Uma2 family endonuclease
MKAAALIPVEEYLHTTYRPDRDYVDGEVLERNMGEKDRSRLQREIVFYFRSREQAWQAFCFPEQRIQVAPHRFRIPDVCVVLGKEPDGQVFTEPPFICVEILSKGDTLLAMQERIDDYLAFGVRYVWVIHPRGARAWIYTKGAITEAKDGILETGNPVLTLPLAEILPR